jgi:hypothetical protein
MNLEDPSGSIDLHQTCWNLMGSMVELSLITPVMAEGCHRV